MKNTKLSVKSILAAATLFSAILTGNSDVQIAPVAPSAYGTLVGAIQRHPNGNVNYTIYSACNGVFRGNYATYLTFAMSGPTKEVTKQLKVVLRDSCKEIYGHPATIFNLETSNSNGYRYYLVTCVIWVD